MWVAKWRRPLETVRQLCLSFFRVRETPDLLPLKLQLQLDSVLFESAFAQSLCLCPCLSLFQMVTPPSLVRQTPPAQLTLWTKRQRLLKRRRHRWLDIRHGVGRR